MKQENGKIIFNISEYKNYFFQRNNQFKYDYKDIHVSGLDMCNVTAMCKALYDAGYTFPKGTYEQPEDNLAEFIFHNEEMREYYKRISPYAKDFEAGKKGAYTPIEVHQVLSYGTNKWLEKQATTFSQQVPIKSLFKEITQRKKPCVISGTFPLSNGKVLNHIVTMVGLIFDCRLPVDAVNVNVMPVSIICDDPYGRFDTDYKERNGNDVIMPFDYFMKNMKALNSENKWAHIIN